MFRFWKKKDGGGEDSDSLYKLAAEVDDLQSFLKFADALRRDRVAEVTEQPNGPHPNSCDQGSRGWNNHSIEDFLEAAHAWGTDADPGEASDWASTLASKSPWLFFAAFLYMGKVYE